MRRRPGKELKWRPLPSGTDPSASVRGAATRDEPECLRGFAEAAELRCDGGDR